MQVALREGYLDVVFAKLGFNFPQKQGLGAFGSGHQFIAHPNHQFKIQAVVAKFNQPHFGLARGVVGDCAINSVSSIQCGLPNKVFVATISHTEGNVNSAKLFTEAPVDDLAVDELGVRYDDVDIVARGDAGKAQANFIHNPGCTRRHFHKVANLQAALNNQNDARHEVAEDVL